MCCSEKLEASALCQIHQRLSGGGERIRTDALLRARQALSQLSYTPESIADLGFLVADLLFYNPKSNVMNPKSRGGPGWS